ncbi:MAG: Ig-like domain-containing protein, partial [Verrucomicrobia bacterium]|nr:Ig-like domain-containing protein [Verrucomicrobiota bacterium]
MQTNLTLQASFVDTSKPVLAITAPTANQRWSNAVFTVRGTAKDNMQVTEVWCQTNGVWGPASIGGAGTNWTMDVALVPGTNTVRAYAVDGTGNRSLTNSVSFVYVLSDRLQVRTIGQGTLTPNYSNAVLEIGMSYSMKASGLNGHGFTNWVVSTNWVGGVTSNNGTLSFIMQSNLTLQASFVDTNRPVLAITAPTTNQRWSNAVFTVRGTAKDNVQVTEVWCQTNGVWGPASVGGAGTNWTMDVALVPGTNTVRACAVDGAGNRSLTNSVSFVYVLNDRLQVRATGPCTMSPNYSNAVLEIGKTYSTTVTPGTGFVLSNWTGTAQGSLTLVSNAAKLTFNMQSNLVLQAHVIANPFTPAKGTYNGLFTPGTRAQDNSGFFTLTLSDSGSYSASLKCGTSTYPFTGQFDVAGQSDKVILRPGTNAWAVAMRLDFSARGLWGAVSNGVIGGWVADLLADQAVFDARTNPATWYAGSYTLNIPGGTNQDGTIRLGDGYLTLGVDTGGKMTYSGWLAEGTAVGPISVPVSAGGHAPLYVPLYSGKGS